MQLLEHVLNTLGALSGPFDTFASASRNHDIIVLHNLWISVNL